MKKIDVINAIKEAVESFPDEDIIQKHINANTNLETAIKAVLFDFSYSIIEAIEVLPEKDNNHY